MSGKPVPDIEKKDTKRFKGIEYLMYQLEINEIITQEDIKVFLNDLKLPEMDDDELYEKMKIAGATAAGFIRLNEFFNFIKNQIYDGGQRDGVQAFSVFDKAESGFIAALYLRTIMSNLGDSLSSDEIDDMIRISDLDGDGTINYEEVIKLFIQTTFDPMSDITK